MNKIVVHSGHQLQGNVKIEGAKNAVLPILAASILASTGKSVIKNSPILSDVEIMNQVLKSLHLKVDFAEKINTITVDATGELTSEAPFEYVSKMRASIVVLGPLLARLGRARVSLPGGCAIGSRPIDIHLKGFEAMGAKINLHDGYVEAIAPDGLKGSNIYFDFPSVGATQNVMMAATLASGTTIIRNVAREPEIIDLANMLNDMGAKISGAGSDTLTIEGVQELHGTEHSVVQDRIEAGTYMAAAALTGGNVLIEAGIMEHNIPFIAKLREMGVTVEQEEKGIRVVGPAKLNPVDVETAPYPGFPTDMQPQMTVLQLAANGVSTLTENVFENRFMHLDELRRMNAKYEIKGKSVVLHGPTNFKGAEVAATDLRAAAALIMAGLVANGTTFVTNLQYLDRGYYEIEAKLRKLGADIKRIEND
ncbi:UDP-N-acetylglucosamine 1-carboxyvinyltransferase [Fructilactobacillus vespulae]|uniref:UDP-N-acetylglucosamine 1-carboxyvinyltransferase n=1 Tax=Fructilactobacillus vespulae TaxID=1249630 RepID=UPI0039B4B60C